MANYNKILLMGNLTRDPELTYLPSNTPVVEFGIAVNRKFKKQSGEQGEEVCFVDCRSYGRTAEVINQYFKKGRPIFIEGRLQLDQWQDKEGNKRSRHRVFVENFQFVESRGGGDEGGNEGGGSSYRGASRPAPAGRASSSGSNTPPPPPEMDMNEEDIPF